MLTLTIINRMKHSPLRNYAGIPGLTSWLIGEKSPAGCVRLFECERNHDEAIIPHSHRFDFECFVMAGEVRNVIYTRTYPTNGPKADAFFRSTLKYGGHCGTYEREPDQVVYVERTNKTYTQGQTYGMKANEIHSIYFSKGARVLFFEGPQVSDSSVILEPWCDGEAVPTFKIEPWMFKKASAPQSQGDKA